MIDRDDLRFEIDRLKERLEYIEQDQRRAYSRIRQDVANLSVLIGLLAGIWAIIHNDWPRWLIVAVVILMPVMRYRLARQIEKEERTQPR